MEYIRARGKKLYSGENHVLLRGFGLGGWLLPEGYMWKLYKNCDRPRRMENMIEELCGEEYARSFWSRYYDGYITGKDIQFIAEQGFNSVRLPLNSRHLYCFERGELILLDDMMSRVDTCIEWCKDNGLYLILDMHGAPGGQTGQNIDDSENDVPELFTDLQKRVELISLWRALAKRYAAEPAVAGYDLLNEPLPEWWCKYNDMLIPLYEEIIEAIREVDKEHLVILEGAHWATDFSVFEEWHPPEGETNLMLQFHKYWSAPDKESLYDYLSASDRIELPLFMGEGGENNLEWYTAAFSLYEKQDISWSFWSYKKMDAKNSPVSFPFPDGWQRLIDYLDGGEKPSQQEAVTIFDNFLNAIQRNNINGAVLRVLKYEAPLSIPCEFYDKCHAVHPRPQGAVLRMSDAADIQFANGRKGVPDYKRYGGEGQPESENLVVVLHENEWVRYDFNVADDGLFDISVVALRNGVLAASCSGVTQQYEVDGCCTAWLKGIFLKVGCHTAEVRCTEGIVAVDTVDIIKR